VAIRRTASAAQANAFGINYDANRAHGGLPRPGQNPTAFSSGDERGGFSMVYSVYTEAHTQDFGTHWFLARQEDPFNANDYFGVANRLDAGTWRFSISAGSEDFFAGSDAIVLGRWYRMGFRRKEFFDGFDPQQYLELYYDLPKVDKVITGTPQFGNGEWVLDTTHALRFGDVAWSTTEGIDGRFGAIKIWEDYLTAGALLAESQSIWPVCREYRHKLWACIPFVTYGDMRDYSGRGNNFSILFDNGLLSHITGPGNVRSFGPFDPRLSGVSAGPTAALTGTAMASITEADIV